VRRAINVILQGDGTPFGVLEVDSRSPGEFSEHDIAFLQGAANIVGMAIERQRFERNLRQALEHQQVLVGEINHRVKNSLQLVASMLSLQAAATEDETLSQILQLAVGRITAVARIHERLYRSPEIGTVDLGAYLGDVSADLAALAPNIEVTYKSEHHGWITADHAVRVALLATELVMNAAKHGYPSGGRGRITITLSATSTPNSVLLVVKDDGVGLPPDFDITKLTGLGMRIVRALVDQMEATLDVDSSHVGAEFRITIPLQVV
jgi:two-component sensor histidine kinase